MSRTTELRKESIITLAHKMSLSNKNIKLEFGHIHNWIVSKFLAITLHYSIIKVCLIKYDIRAVFCRKLWSQSLG